MRIGVVIGMALAAGCAGRAVHLPAGHLPPAAGRADEAAVVALAAKPPNAGRDQPGRSPVRSPFALPPALPGAAAPPIAPPRVPLDAPAAQREKAVTEAYPVLTPAAAVAPTDGPPVTLADLQTMAAANSPVLRRAAADAEAAYGQVVQAGLHPNPTVGYQGDQVQPSLRLPPGSTISGAGQHGGFVNQLIKTCGKLALAQRVAGFDYVNALVAVRRAEVEVAAAVRGRYFAVLVARQTVEVNAAVADLAGEVYRLQLQQVAAGVAAGYEPLLVYAQAEQARAAVTQAEAQEAAAWRQLAAAVGRPDLPPAPLAGAADAPPPHFDLEGTKARLLDRHTDLLTGRNAVEQAKANLVLQRRQPVPDLQTNQYHQFDNLAQTYQFGVQLGIELPTYDRNQGNVRSAAARIARASHDLRATENDLLGRLAEAYGRYAANKAAAERYRDKVLPNLGRAYRAVVERYQVEPAKVGISDIAVAQQNLATALQAYLAALAAQWQAVVDVANLGQLDDLYPPTADAAK